MAIRCDDVVHIIIGSPDSVDLDTLYIFKELPTTQECYRFCDDFSTREQADKKIENRNIIILDSQGFVSECFKVVASLPPP